jgi:hypothetical protein
MSLITFMDQPEMQSMQELARTRLQVPLEVLPAFGMLGDFQTPTSRIWGALLNCVRESRPNGFRQQALL